MTAEIINLNKFRKARDKAEAEMRAEQNRVRYGRSKAEKERSAGEERAKERSLDGAERTSRRAADDSDGDGGSDPGSAS